MSAPRRALFLLAFAGGVAHAQGDIVVNAVALDRQTLVQLQQLYPVAITPGRYWYDPVSGVYGIEGAPPSGQMLPGLRLGGPLRADASRGTMPVFINGRQLTQGEVLYIALACRTQVMPGRYWINSWGLGGFEGGPPLFNMAQCGAPQGSQGGGSRTKTWCDPNGACTSSGILGTITTAPGR